MGLSPEVLENLKKYPINKRIRRFRTMMGLTQKEFAKKISCSQISVSNWESGWTVPMPLMIDKIIQEFNLPIDFFLDAYFIEREGVKK